MARMLLVIPLLILPRNSSSGGTMVRSKTREAFAIAMIVLLVLARDAHAYTDPGTGALIWQMLLAASVGFMFYARRLFAWVRGRRSGDKTDDSESLQSDAADDSPHEAANR